MKKTKTPQSGGASPPKQAKSAQIRSFLGVPQSSPELLGKSGGEEACAQRKTEGQQLKGKIVLALFHTLSHFSTLILPNFSYLKIRLLKENFKKKKKKNKPFCTLVVARLSSSDVRKLAVRIWL